MAARARNWLLTLNQKEGESLPDAEYWLRSLYEETGAAYVVGQLEAGDDTQRLHIQAYANYKEKMGFSKLKKFANTVNLREVKIDNGVRQYCMKQDTRVAGPWEFGKIPLARNSKADWDAVKEAAKRGEFDKIPPDIFMRNYNNIRSVFKDYCVTPDHTTLRGIYIYGKSGIGKSSLARGLFPGESIYYKNHNKWFDGYRGESVIIWDDLGLEHPKLFSQYFKIWTDRYGCRGEVKGGVVPLTHKYFIFTSQYSFETMFTEEETYEALGRRCFIYHMEYYKDLDIRTIFDIQDMEDFHSSSEAVRIELFIRRKRVLDRSDSKVMTGQKGLGEIN